MLYCVAWTCNADYVYFPQLQCRYLHIVHFTRYFTVLYKWCLFGRVTFEIDYPRKPLSTDAKRRSLMLFDGCHVQLVSSSNSNGTIGVLKTYPYNGSYNATCFEMHHCDNISFIVRLHIFKLWTAWLSISNVDEY